MQALEYLKIYADETNAVEEEILEIPPSPGMLTAKDIFTAVCQCV